MQIIEIYRSIQGESSFAGVPCIFVRLAACNLRCVCTLLLETSGERPLERVPQAVHKIVDVKCPGSGEGGTFLRSNLETLTPRDEVKFVLADRADYEFARGFARERELDRKVNSVIFSPVFLKNPSVERDASNCQLDPRLLAEWILEDQLNVRLGLQIHKFIWEPAAKGV
jgi:7-carboxy-7-deazaguanine synthase